MFQYLFRVVKFTCNLNLNFLQIFKIIRDGNVASRPNLGQIRGPKSQSGT